MQAIYSIFDAALKVAEVYVLHRVCVGVFRAKLGEALERMDRVVQAIEQDAVQPSPYTVQLATHLQQANTNSVSPALQQASSC